MLHSNGYMFYNTPLTADRSSRNKNRKERNEGERDKITHKNIKAGTMK
jgi:hypothetical protein